MFRIPELALCDFDSGNRVSPAIPCPVHAEADAPFVKAGGLVMVAATGQMVVRNGLRHVRMGGAVKRFVERAQI
jgi:hypothetical protein